MQMTNSEIRASYRDAKFKKKQVEILAQLNDCGKKEIIKILADGGFDMRWAARDFKGTGSDALRSETQQSCDAVGNSQSATFRFSETRQSCDSNSYTSSGATAMFAQQTRQAAAMPQLRTPHPGFAEQNPPSPQRGRQETPALAFNDIEAEIVTMALTDLLKTTEEKKAKIEKQIEALNILINKWTIALPGRRKKED